jgi:dienelactone hydrolase
MWKLAVIVLGFAHLCASGVELTSSVPVKTRDAHGQAVTADLTLTVFRPPGGGPFPAVVLNHGRPGPTARQAMGRVKLSSVTTAFLGQGFVVVVPTRIGYGVAQGPDVEFSLSCDRPAYAASFAAAADQVQAAVTFARALPYVDPERLLLVGHSMGGAATITAAARNLPGVRAAVSFSGGQGARATTPGEPCGADVLKETFAGYGAMKSPIPQLWIHTENDRQFSLARASEWFSAYQHAGGQGQLQVFPAFRDDGHWWFASEPHAWMPAVKRFFDTHDMGR